MDPFDRTVGDPDREGGALPSSPTGRVPQWVLDEAAGVRVDPIPWRSPGPPPRPVRRRGRRLLRGLLVVPLVVVLSLVAAVLVGPSTSPWSSVTPAPPTAVPSATPPTPTSPPDRPTAGIEAARRPLGTPLPAPPEGGPYGFIAFQPDGVTPVTYDPCRPVHYVLRPDNAPPGGEEAVHAAFARLSEVTGLRFVHDGPSDEPTTLDRPVFQPDRYGDRWAPVLVAWETEEQNPALAGDTVGQAGSVAVSLGEGTRVFVSGTVSLDAGRLPEILSFRDGAETVRAIVLHELGHLVGLAHVDDPAQLMYPEARREVPDLGPGDLTGLEVLGSGPCVPEL
ncbi:matrixin family metalloprotease [Blastococcus haudaquaticus]|uniref:Matrixin n=1 Tax=Blastococcus haudaquaticus TaxID=1938745 RepID=A0A286GJ46_9ACTN|nr:matrixin family metalloprotease [Blastococcus haudaquaticus]SOD95502.1 Matrixin [Blastococcus haudaquaticus]